MFGISRQSIYQQIERSKKRSEELKKVKSLVLEKRMSMSRLGTRKLYYLLKEILNEQQIKIGRDGLFNLLRAENMLIKSEKNYTKTTHSKHWLRKYPNLLSNQKIERADQVYVSDITYIKSRERTHYLSLVTDAFSRKIVAYHLSDDMSSENVVKALKMGLKNRKGKQSLIHHSDRGLQYCSSIYQKELQLNNITPSMTDGHDCYQNALAERMNGIHKHEFLVYKCNTAKELKVLIDQSIKTYNNERPHLSLNMKTPNLIHKKSREDILSAFN